MSRARARRRRRRIAVGGLLLTLLAHASAAQTREPDGARLYAAECAYCHGPTAAGDGSDAGLFVHAPPALGAVARADAEALVRRILDGASGSLALDAAAIQRGDDRREALVSHLRRLPRVDWRAAARGRSLYLARCERCHGWLGRPATVIAPGKRPRTLSDPAFQAAVDDATLRAAVRHGGAGMPPLPQAVDDDEAGALTAYIRLLSPGYEAYERLCAACHGEDGLGAGSGSSAAVGRARIAFDAAYMATHDDASLRRDVWHMLDDGRPVMPHLRGALRDDEARAIVTYLRSVPSVP